MHHDSVLISGMKNPEVHFEILGHDGAELINFYRELFEWRIEDNSLPGWPHYGFMESDDGIGGAVGSADAVPGPAVLVYVEVDDPDSYLLRATAMGATVALPVTEVPGAEVTIAWLRDPQGNLLGLVKSQA
jgi:predicted enzyme related to lactoylglutathione lyase